MVTMNKRTKPRFCITLKRCSTRLLLLSCAGMYILVAGRGVAGSDATEREENSSDSGTVGILSPSATGSEPSSTDSNPGTRDAQSLAGRSTDEVEAALGKPSGKLQTSQGALWLCAEWRIQFDRANHVLQVEKDQPMRLSKLDSRFVASSDAVAKGAYAPAGADDAARAKGAALQTEKIRIVS